jgi:methanogenic corrinoid protein MtbC1
MTDTLGELSDAIGKMNSEEQVMTLLSAAISQGFSTSQIVEKGVRKGLQTVGEKYEAGEYFLSELLYAGSLVEGLLQALKPRMRDEELERKGVIVLGTVRGDIHDIGKNIFKMLADSFGFEVHDLGVDIEPATFVAQVKESTAQVVGLSALLTTALVEMKGTLDALRTAGLKDNLKVLLGGNAVKKEFGAEIGADATALDAVEGLEICKGWMKK